MIEVRSRKLTATNSEPERVVLFNDKNELKNIENAEYLKNSLEGYNKTEYVKVRQIVNR